jgi:hypothetical protein
MNSENSYYICRNLLYEHLSCEESCETVASKSFVFLYVSYTHYFRLLIYINYKIISELYRAETLHEISRNSRACCN